MTLSKAYDELTDNPEFRNGLTMGNNQSIYDSAGFSAIEFIGFTTRVNAPNGDRVFDTDIAAGGTKSLWYANSNRDVGIYDDQFDGNAVSYISSASAPGTLELTNANLNLSENSIQLSPEVDSSFRIQNTTSVGTTSTEIFNGITAGMAIVTGENTSDVTDEFVDVLLYNFGDFTVIASNERQGPDSRTYSGSGSNLSLSMSTNTYDITVTGLTADPQQL